MYEIDIVQMQADFLIKVGHISAPRGIYQIYGYKFRKRT